MRRAECMKSPQPNLCGRGCCCCKVHGLLDAHGCSLTVICSLALCSFDRCCQPNVESTPQCSLMHRPHFDGFERKSAANALALWCNTSATS